MSRVLNMKLVQKQVNKQDNDKLQLQYVIIIKKYNELDKFLKIS